MRAYPLPPHCTAGGNQADPYSCTEGAGRDGADSVACYHGDLRVDRTGHVKHAAGEVGELPVGS